MSDVTRILNAVGHNDPHAAEQLLPAVYEELRKLAAHKLAHEKPGHTLQATALVHEAYVRLVGEHARAWDSRGHFFAAAAEAMRRILVESARRKMARKHGGGLQRLQLADLPEPVKDEQIDLVLLDEALRKLEILYPQKALVV